MSEEINEELTQKEMVKRETERKEAINHILSEILSEEELNNYHALGESLGAIYGMVFTLEKEGILKAFGEEAEEKIKTALDVITIYTQKGIESELTKEKAEKVRQKLIDSDLV